MQRGEVAERHRLAARQQFTESLLELGPAVQRQRAGREPVKGVVGVKDAGTAGRLPGEFDGRFDRLGAGIAEEHAADLLAAARQELLGEQARQQRAVHLHHVGQIEVEGLVQRRLERRMAAPEGVNPEAGKQIQVTIALGVEQVATFAADIEAIEADRLQHARQLMVQVLFVQRVVLTVPCREHRSEIE